MKNFLLNRICTWIGGKLNGKKTWLAGAGFILLALVGCLGKIYPDAGLPEQEWETIGNELGAGLAVFGIGHKIIKAQELSTSESLPCPGAASTASSAPARAAGDETINQGG